jgi:signal recognition particle subunit SRP54
LMNQLSMIDRRVSPDQVYLVVDAMTGQDAVNSAKAFNEALELDGVIMTKLDGDARGGAALSVKQVTGVPIKYVGTGEHLDALEEFHPERMAQRILGMGDMLSLIEKAEDSLDQEQAMQAAQKLVEGDFDLEDFLKQLQQVKKMGPISKLLEMIPGMSQFSDQLTPEVTEDQFKQIESLIQSMTRQERQDPRILNASRKRRIAQGSGRTVQQVNQLLHEFRQMQRMMKQMTGGKGMGRNLMSLFR